MIDLTCVSKCVFSEAQASTVLVGCCCAQRRALYRYKTRSHVMLKKKEEELRRAIAAAPQAEGALQKALSQVIDLLPIQIVGH